jgi:hypothetical protein
MEGRRDVWLLRRSVLADRGPLNARARHRSGAESGPAYTALRYAQCPRRHGKGVRW